MKQDWKDRFWGKVSIGSKNDHWIWGGYLQEGYGKFKSPEGKMRLAHRLAWILTNGDIENNLQVLHSCDMPACCNPNHLFLGTHQDNMDDKVRKGRSANVRGEKNPRAKLTESDVIRIRETYSKGRVTIRELADKYGVSRAAISFIITRFTWNHL